MYLFWPQSWTSLEPTVLKIDFCRLSCLFFVSIRCTYIFDILSAPEIKTDEVIYESKANDEQFYDFTRVQKKWRHENWDVLRWRAIYFALKDFMVLAHKNMFGGTLKTHNTKSRELSLLCTYTYYQNTCFANLFIWVVV